MSQENVETSRRAYDAFNRRDLDAFLPLCGAEADVAPFFGVLEGTYRGHDGVRAYWRDLFGAFPDFHLEVLELRDYGDTTVGAVRIYAHGLGSAAPVDELRWHVATWRAGTFVRLRSCGTEAEALEAAGLRE